jgi:hydroxyethylthiazole kinase-like uncharacterized protein yjeF
VQFARQTCNLKTPEGQIMTELLTAAQIRAVEEAAIASGEVTGLELMERAGQGVVEAIFEEWPDLAVSAGGFPPPDPRKYLATENEAARRAVVLCGPGNNGGDGFVVARLLKERGWSVEVFLYGDAGALPPDAEANLRRWAEAGEVRAWKSDEIAALTADLVVDAVFGTGLRRAAPVEIAEPLAALGARGLRIVAVDAPSGLCLDSGRVLGIAPAAAAAGLTVSFHTLKVGHLLGEAPWRCGRVRTKPIGLRSGPDVSAVRLFELPNVSGRGSGLGKAFGAQKYDHGHALILSGGPGKGGAARMAARGALRIGAGLVTVACPLHALGETASRLDAVMVRPFGEPDGVGAMLADERFTACLLGPGLGLDQARLLVPVVRAAGRATVLDADALSAYADDPDTLFAMLDQTCVLTPHAGEFGRIFPDIAARLAEPAVKGPAFSKVDATREAAARAGCVVLFKGPDTVIADPAGRCSINSANYDRAAPWLATAGSGDVLAGFIAGLLARGLAPMQAAETAAWLHVECALSFGPGLIAEDLPEELPKVFRKLGL